MEVSIIIPFYNASETIKNTLDSVLKQSHRKFECILIDDSSTDNSSTIVKKYISIDKRFKLIKQAKRGVVSARNLGIEKSIGRYITFLDADDIWHQDFLKESLNIRNKKEIALTHAPYFRFKVYKNKIKTFLIKPPQIINKKNILRKNFMPLLTVLIDRNIVKELYFEDKRPEDYRLWIKLIYMKKLESISVGKALGFYRISEKQRSNNKFMNLIRMYKFFSDLPNSNFLRKNLNTLNWITYNLIQRVTSIRSKDKQKLHFLESLIFHSKNNNL